VRGVILKFLYRLLGSGLGTGYSPFASGTAGSAVGVLIWVLLMYWPAFQQSALIQIAFVAITFLIGVPLCTHMEKSYGHDPSQATFDEFVGQWCSLILLPKTLPWLAASFFIFRALDVWKPYPARGSQVLPGGWGIMIDDLIVGVYTCLLLHGVKMIL
jgi:phosphatidylglycerophosphatase A